MPFSTPIFKQETFDFLTNKFGPSTTILDLGAGCGTYSDLLKSKFTNMDAVEIHQPYIDQYDLKNKYNNVYNENALNFEFDYYDIIILGDILEHIDEREGIELIEKLYKKCNELIIGIPFNSEQGVHFDNIYEIHLQAELTNESFLEKYKGFRPLALRYDYGIYIKNNKSNQKVLVEYDIYEHDKIDYYDSDLKPVYINKNKANSDLTIVTGLWNIGRNGRSFDHYIQHFNNVLDIDANLFIYIPAEYEHLVWAKRKKHNTYVKIYELEDIKNDIYSPHWDKTQEIRTSNKWVNQTGEHGWLKSSPQASLEWYNPIVQSKMFFLHSASLWNPFKTNYFLWLDAGITNTVYEKYFTDNKCLDNIIPYLKTFLFLSYPYEARDEIHGFNFEAINRYAREKVTYVCRGGLFGGHKDFISQASSTYYALLQDASNEGHMGTEESLFSIMAHLEPHIYRRYALDENGLVVKFIQALMDNTVELEDNGTRAHVLPKGTYNESTDKTTLYMLTFNFPQQIEHTLATWEANSPDWLSKPRKVLIDNSTDENAKIGNKEVASKYGFEYIAMNENKGINGGRLFAAEHFDKSDSDYYFFFEDDMGFYPSTETGFCRNGFKKYVPNLYKTAHEIMAREEFDFLKLSYTEVYMDNNIQVSWYNVPQSIRSSVWPDYNQLPVNGLDPYAPRTQFDRIEVYNELSYISGDIYYANWPMIVNKTGNRKMFLDVKWDHPYEQTWMSYIFQETLKKNIKPAVLLAAPVWHNRIIYYKPEERREN
jgi:hypothetical protein